MEAANASGGAPQIENWRSSRNRWPLPRRQHAVAVHGMARGVTDRAEYELDRGGNVRSDVDR